MGKVITICQNKGGVGKTTLAFNLAECLAKRNKKVLLLDTDAQANLTSYFASEDTDYSGVQLYDAMINDTKLKPAKTINENISIVPADLRLSDIDYSLAQKFARETILASKVRMLADDFDYIIIDTAPNLGLLTINSLLCADSLLIPLIPEPFSVQGLNMIRTLLKRLNEAMHKDFKMHIVLQKVKNTSLHKEMESELRSAYGDAVCKQTIKDGIKYAEKSIQSEMNNAYEYTALTEEVMNINKD